MTSGPSTGGSPPVLPEQLGEYKLLERLGEGGMGIVYRAWHQRLKRHVAVKVLNEARNANPQAAARFEREMEAIGQLDDPHIVRALDAGTSAGRHYLAMDYVDGQTLAEIVERRGPLPPREACECIRQAALGLGHAHQHGLVHRDIKPSNLIVDRRGMLRVLDLGLARQVAGDSAELTRDGQTVGTIDYMAPEQAATAGTVDIRADLYALGCTLFKLLSGQPPFPSAEFPTPAEKLLAHAAREPSFARLPPGIPPGVVEILRRLLAKDPARRYSTPAEVAAQLEPFSTGADLRALLDSQPWPTLPASATTATDAGSVRRGSRRAAFDALESHAGFQCRGCRLAAD